VSYLGTRGYRQRAGLPQYPWRFGAAFGLTLAWMAFFNFAVRHEGLRVAVVPLFSGAMLFLGARAILRPQRRPRTPDRATARFLIVFGCFEMVLTALALRIGPTHNVPALQVYNTTLLLGVPSLYVANGLMGMLILTSDLVRRMELLAETDTLTGLLNRRGFEREAEEAIEALRGAGSRLAVVLADIDHFKRVNDRYGHGVGDVALVRFCAYLTESFPEGTVIGRLGGEEFVALLEGLSEARVVEIAEAVRAGVARISLADYDAEPFTASFGIAKFELWDTKLADLLPRADIALYHAKATGRNRVCLFDESLTPLHAPREERRTGLRVEAEG
jgi:diguanylate cyclase (GGDEF)-like protein